MSTSIQDHLRTRFADHRIVVWHDPDGTYEADLQTYVPVGVTVLQIANNEFAIKHRVLREDATTQFLLYRSGPAAEGTGNWLLDVELAYGVPFTADRSALLRAELGLDDPDVDALIAEHASFFLDPKLVERLKELIAPGDDPVMVRAKMSAVGIGQKEHSLSELTRTLLVQQAKGNSPGYDTLSKHGLTGFHWAGVNHIYGYSSQAPTVAGFILWIFQQARDGFDVVSSNTARNLAIDFRSFRDSKRSASAIKALARKAEEDLGYQEHVAEIEWTSLKDADIFEADEREVIHRLVEGVVNQTMPHRETLETITARRRDSFWFEDYAIVYEALAAAAELLPMIRAARLEFNSFDEGLTRYRDELFRADQLYRQFTHAYQTAEFKQPLDDVAERVEAAYVTNFLAPLGMSWQQQVDSVDRWGTHAREVTAQSSFYRNYIAKLTKSGTKKAVVVISDAMRYEVAKELESKILGLDKFDGKTDAMLGVLPSYTQLGMAALLPHKTLAHSPDGDPVLVDGMKSDGSANRNSILRSVGGAAIQAKDFVEMKPVERRELYSSHQVLYVYHDTIDATGDNAKSEHRTFAAVSEALDQLVDIVRKLASANATNIFVTADHGFLYQRSKLAPQFNLTVKPEGDQIVAEKRRYALGRGLKEHAAFRTFHPGQLGLSGDLEVQIPNSIHRIVKPGAGFQFVHGGASLQEIVVPVVVIKKGRFTTVEPVNVDIHPESDKVTTGQIVVKLYQSVQVEPQRTARRLRAGLYFGEQLISDEQEMVFDSESPEGRDRFQSVRLLLSKDADAANNQGVEFRLLEPIEGTDQWKKYKSVPYTIKRSFTTDFDF
ncbi:MULTISPECIES: BREX-1 system phosphatase PglZ type A [unclassified Pseudarthrobacter]|uniref:BREX-1 system phosphatase PglZ type A n=1 Tax=unclassified Pseudarthrobacter TaxID=2647000 RepID=UPI003633ABA2